VRLTEEVEEHQLVGEVTRRHLGGIVAAGSLFNEPLHEVVRSVVVFACFQWLKHVHDSPSPVPSW
jgi:hypothetical protein